MDNNYDLIAKNKEFFKEFSDSPDAKFKNVENKLSRCELTHALLVFERVLGDDMPKSGFGGSEHDVVFFLEHDTEAMFFEKATEQDLKEVACCGIFYSEEYDSLCAFT